VNSRGRRTQLRAEARAQAKVWARKALELQRSYRVKAKRKIKNEGE
jgi:hypothetical protein